MDDYNYNFRSARRVFEIWAEQNASLARLERNIQLMRSLSEELHMILINNNLVINVSDVYFPNEQPVIDVLSSNPNVSQDIIIRVRNLHNTLRWRIRDIYVDLELLMGDYYYLNHLPGGRSSEYNDLSDPIYITESQRRDQLNSFIRIREYYIMLVLWRIIPLLSRSYGNFNLFLH